MAQIDWKEVREFLAYRETPGGVPMWAWLIPLGMALAAVVIAVITVVLCFV